jgi:hypothetical protein
MFLLLSNLKNQIAKSNILLVILKSNSLGHNDEKSLEINTGKIEQYFQCQILIFPQNATSHRNAG